MSPTADLQASSMPLKQHGYEEILTLWDNPPKKISFLRAFGYPFVINHSNQKSTSFERDLFSKLEEKAVSIQNQINAFDAKNRIKEFGKKLYDTYTFFDPYSQGDRTYGNHPDSYKRELFCNDCLFDQSLRNRGTCNSLISFFSNRLDWFFQNDQDALLKLSNNLSTHFSAFYPNHHLILSANPAKKSAILLYSLWLTTEYNFQKKDNPNLQDYLPIQKERIYPRSTSLHDNIDQISSYILIVESFPLGSIERLRAMEKLWEDEKNYYAGWELYSMYKQGSMLTSTSQNFRWVYPPTQKRTDSILKDLLAQHPSPCVKFLNSPLDVLDNEYFPATLRKFALEIQPATEMQPEHFKLLAQELEELSDHSLDAKILHGMLYKVTKDTSKFYNTTYLIFQKDTHKRGIEPWEINKELGDLIFDHYRTTFEWLSTGALNGSWNCINALLQNHASDKRTAFLMTKLITQFAVADIEQLPGLFCKLLDNYNEAFPSANWTGDLLDIHISNLELVKHHLNICLFRLLHNTPRDRQVHRRQLQTECENLHKQAAELIHRIKNYTLGDSFEDSPNGMEYPPMHSSLPE